MTWPSTEEKERGERTEVSVREKGCDWKLSGQRPHEKAASQQTRRGQSLDRVFQAKGTQ